VLLYRPSGQQTIHHSGCNYPGAWIDDVVSKISKEEESSNYLTKSLQAQQNAPKKSPDERMSGLADNLDERM
jgi:hypothetical protein